MSIHAERIREWIAQRRVQAQLLQFEHSVHSVAQAVAVSGHPVERFTKSIVMLDEDGRAIVAVVPARSRASTERVRKALALAQRPRIATASESETLLGQQIGGNSPLNADNARVLIDPEVLAMDWILTGGGDARSLVRISIAELRRVVGFTEARVRK
jgi:prolyl-tRNA editing enzyme YbaK/EbsC (Cys-tRNA(Pro) deacylase)